MGKNKNSGAFLSGAFHPNPAEKIVLYWPRKQGRLFTCLQTKNWAEPRCNEVQGLGKYACCSQRTLHLRQQIVGLKIFALCEGRGAKSCRKILTLSIRFAPYVSPSLHSLRVLSDRILHLRNSRENGYKLWARWDRWYLRQPLTNHK